MHRRHLKKNCGFQTAQTKKLDRFSDKKRIKLMTGSTSIKVLQAAQLLQV